VKNASNRDDSLTPKYDIKGLELRSNEFRNESTVKNGAGDYVGGSPMLSFLSYCYETGARACFLSSSFWSLAVFGLATVDFGLGFPP